MLAGRDECAIEVRDVNSYRAREVIFDIPHLHANGGISVLRWRRLAERPRWEQRAGTSNDNQPLGPTRPTLPSTHAEVAVYEGQIRRHAAHSIRRGLEIGFSQRHSRGGSPKIPEVPSLIRTVHGLQICSVCDAGT